MSSLIHHLFEKDDLSEVQRLVERMPVREQEILVRAAEGKTDKVIAIELGISSVTVNSYWRRILLRFDATSRTEVVAKVVAAMSRRAQSQGGGEADEGEASLLKARDLAHRNMLEVITQTCLDALSRRRNLRAVFEELLRSTLGATDSEYGFIGEVLKDEGGNPYLKTYALTNISWNQATRELYDREHAKGLTFRNLDTIFGHVMVTGQLYISNDPANDTHRGGLPHGHPPLNSFLGVPLHSNGELIGMIGIANQPGGYELEDLPRYEPLFSTIGALVVTAKAEQNRQAAEAAANEVRVSYAKILETLPCGVLFEDENRQIKMVNEAFCSMLGISSSRAVSGLDCSELLEAMKEMFKDPEAEVSRVNALIARGKDAKGDTLEFADGRVLVRDFTRLLIDGVVRGYIWYFREQTS
jgi:DNA-binding CsgD family transcriptional regulator